MKPFMSGFAFFFFFLAWNNVFMVHPRRSRCQSFIPVVGWITAYGLCAPPLISPFIG